ncbi:hypothetical protein MAR_002917 [Mya arenaria]|uniref:Uncharacterized protein n=1 Tax=Mya arenaria TaxID=6604 RepID=A0ABY7G7L3_MYAAR|nr:hypothetical protein MAR_002917 [Mya arenaria]
MKFEADLNKPAPHERTSLLEKCNEKKARDDPPVEEILYPRINYIEENLLTTEQNLGILSSHIGKCWQYYSDRLGLIEEDRDVIVAKYPESTQLQIYHMLKQAARLPHNQNMGTMLTLLEKCAEEFVDMRVDWDMIEYYFADAVGIAEEPSNERDGKGGPSSRGLKRKLNIQSGEMSVKIQRV